MTVPKGPQFVVEVQGSLDWYVIGSKVSRFRRVALPSSIRTLAWAGKQPVLLLDNDQVAVVDGDKLEILPLPPATTWASPQPPGTDEHLDRPMVRMFTKNEEIWLGHCEWTDTGGLVPFCDHWINARLRPLPVITVAEYLHDNSYGRMAVTAPPTPIAAATAIKAVLVPDRERHKGKRDKLQCTDAGKVIEDPPVGSKLEAHFDADSEGGRSDLVWLSSEPPIFQVSDWDNCRPCPSTVIYERCKRSERFDAATFGPYGLMAFFNYDPEGKASAALYQRGRELPKFDEVRQLVFVP